MSHILEDPELDKTGIGSDLKREMSGEAGNERIDETKKPEDS